MPYCPEGWCPLPPQDRRHEQFVERVRVEQTRPRVKPTAKQKAAHSKISARGRAAAAAARAEKRKQAAPKKAPKYRHLTPEQRQRVIDAQGKVPGVELAREYGVSKAAIYHIWAGRTAVDGHTGRPLKS